MTLHGVSVVTIRTVKSTQPHVTGHRSYIIGRKTVQNLWPDVSVCTCRVSRVIEDDYANGIVDLTTEAIDLTGRLLIQSLIS